MVSCQKYSSIISESSQTRNVLAAGLPPTVKVATFLTRKWMSQPSWATSSRLMKMTCSLTAMEKKEGDVWTEVASAATGVWELGSHSSVNMYSQDTSHALLPPSHTGQTARQAGPDIEAQPHREEQRNHFQCPPFLSSVPWQPLTTAKHMRHY